MLGVVKGICEYERREKVMWCVSGGICEVIEGIKLYGVLSRKFVKTEKGESDVMCCWGTTLMHAVSASICRWV